MGLFGFVDDILGTDFEGNKARGYYEKGSAAQQAANQQALQELKNANKSATGIYKNYALRGMNEENAMREDALNVLGSGSQKAIDVYNQRYNKGVAARQPYDQAAISMMGALPQLQAAMGLPGSGSYDVAVSPMYQWQKGQMDKELTAQLNAMGLSGDNVSATIRSDNLSRLGAQETQRQMNDLQNMVGMGMQHGANLGQPQFQSARDISGLYDNYAMNQANILNQGAINRGNTWNNMGQTFGGWEQTLGANSANALIAGGNSAMNAGMSMATKPNAMQELINTGINVWGMGR